MIDHPAEGSCYTGYVMKFDQVAADGTMISSTANLNISKAEPFGYVHGVDLAQPGGDVHVEAIFEADIDSAGKLWGYSLISMVRRTRNGEAY